ncbi:DUF6292 family protein [Saccharothrix syringae]|uniref:DUF6292 domain-containing protein n=1 Tax=Saccharothrix syringae TaxID=103733 RepID=A0A5Q0H7U7_SACSY|nr:DUF6292 family protein [Saccharothrix syringae]QFZ21722.1 hypothetical protein EKG83_33855 [Saccharothrix syringae]
MSGHEVPIGGLRRYVDALAAELGVVEGCACARTGPPACAHLVVTGHLSLFPDYGLLLLWDEEYGWAAALDAGWAGGPVVLSYLGDEVLPPVGEVAAFARALLREERPGDPRPVRLRAVGDVDGLVDRLGRYAS